MVMAASNTAHADIDPITGVDLVRIGAVGNAPWMGNGQVQDRAIGRGRVDYEYSIGKLEVTTAQWVEFLNAALDRPANDRIPYVAVPDFWGGAETFSPIPGGRRFAVRPGQGLLPVGDITWRMAAVLCNWYSNDKRMDRAAFLNGAYDTSTFGFVGNIFTDQLTHNVGAKYWIPTWDEWLKAAHYDPDRNGDGQGGWWVYSNGTDVPLISGPPGVGQANFGFTDGAFTIPLGAYPQTQSPWGLLDVAGGTGEWTEDVLTGGFGIRWRRWEGSYWLSGSGIVDAVFTEGGDDFPHIADYRNGFRIASSVPAPGSCILGAGVFLMIGCTRRRR